MNNGTINSSHNLGYRNSAGLRLSFEKHPKTSAGFLIYGGREVKRLDEKIVAIPWRLVTG